MVVAFSLSSSLSFFTSARCPELVGRLNASSSELDFDRPNIEDYHPFGSIQEPRGKIHLCDLLDISPTLREVASAIVDGSSTDTRMDNISISLLSGAFAVARE